MKMIMFEVLMMFLVFNVDIVAGIIRCEGRGTKKTRCENPLLLGLIPLNPINFVVDLVFDDDWGLFLVPFMIPLMILVRIYYYSGSLRLYRRVLSSAFSLSGINDFNQLCAYANRTATMHLETLQKSETRRERH